VTMQSTGRGTRGDDPVDRAIAGLAPWFHNLHLPDGRQTAPDHPLGDYPRFKWRDLAGAFAADLSGLTALDIGCNAGFYSFELARRGASVVAIDSDEHYLQQARWAAPWLDPAGRVSFRQLGIYELSRLSERFDVVLCLGVLYHLRHPQLALDLLAERVRGRLFLQTLTIDTGPAEAVPADLPWLERERMATPGWPRAAFVERSFAGDPTNWWVFDDACVRGMLRAAGFEVVAAPADEMYECRPAGSPAAARARRAELATVLGAGVPPQPGDSQRK
jgi:tRNA (mo5U34)-methyltransferase